MLPKKRLNFLCCEFFKKLQYFTKLQVSQMYLSWIQSIIATWYTQQTNCQPTIGFCLF